MYIRTLALSAAFGFAMFGEANAAKRILSFDGTCDVGTLSSQPDLKNVYAYLESSKKGSCDDVIAEGTLGAATLNGIDSRWISLGMYNPDVPNEQDMLVVQYPLVTGGNFLFYETTDGKHAQLVFQGSYTVGEFESAATRLPDFRHAH